MGAGGLIAVADTGPLIHLAEIGCLSLLSIFDELHIPEAVWREAERPAEIRVELAIRVELKLARHHQLQSTEVARFTAAEGLESLQRGEQEALFLGRKLEIPLLLTDDLAVRNIAKGQGMTPIGSLGIVGKAYQLGRISRAAAEGHLTALYEISSLFVTRAIVDLAIERLRGVAHTAGRPQTEEP